MSTEEPVRPANSEIFSRATLWAALALAAILLVLFGDVIFSKGDYTPTHALGDVSGYYVHSRPFGFDELARGNVALWNPHTFSGAPFVGVFQTALFYPLNFFYFALPGGSAIAMELALTLWLMGFFTFLWARDKTLHPMACFVSAVAVMLAATSTLRVMSGALSVLETYAWWPLLLLSVDSLSRRSELGWCLAGIAAVTMMILAGHPPTILMAAAATALYCVPIIVRQQARLRFLRALIPVVVAPFFLGAVQLWPGLQTASEGVREAGVDFVFASSYSFPPEQLLTLLAPGAFGDASGFGRTFFGRVLYWDANAFMGVAALFLAIHAAIHVRHPLRSRSLWLCALLMLTALGGYFPLYRLLFEIVPGFSLMRAPSKFMFFALFFAAALAGLGAHRILERAEADRKNELRRSAFVAAFVAALVAVAALWTFVVPADSVGTPSPLAALSGLQPAGTIGQERAQAWHGVLLHSLGIAAASCLAVAVLFFASSKRRRIGVIIAVVAVLELVAFARINRARAPTQVGLGLRTNIVRAYAQARGNRVLEVTRPSNVALGRRGYGLWGYDPVVLGRYARFMARTQGYGEEFVINPGKFALERFHPLHQMLRGEVAWYRNGDVRREGEPLPQALLVRSYELVDGPEAALDAIFAPGFDARRQVILESVPDTPASPAAGHAAPDRLRITGRSTDHLDFEVEVSTPAILVITDSYSRGWRALALPGSSQSEYALLPANYVLRGVPLAAGSHRIRVEYSPWAYRAGAWASVLSAFAFLAAGLSASAIGRKRTAHPRLSGS